MWRSTFAGRLRSTYRHGCGGTAAAARRASASTGLLLPGVPERIVISGTGWSSASMAERHQHVTDPMLRDAGQKIGGLLRGGGGLGPGGPGDDAA